MSHPNPFARLPRLSRRHVLYGGGLVAVSATASACGWFSTDPDVDSKGGGEKGKEAPMLAEQVKAGTLPPVEERLPRNPLVVQPTEGIGRYGGTWRTAVTGEGDGPWMHRTVGYEPLMRWTRDWSGITENVAESITASDDAREFTVTLREGLRWSDGEPLTTRDVEFAYEVLTNRELNQQLNHMLVINGKTCELEVLDEYTFVVRFAEPNGLWVTNNARNWDGELFIQYPRHYLEQFLPDYNPDAEANAKEAGYESWQQYFNFIANDFSSAWNNPDLPTLHPWVVVEPLRGATNRVVFRRNPYYFKVDPEGSQLPYIDEVRYEVITEVEPMLLRAANGDFDFHSRHFNNLENRPTLAESQESGNYTLLDLQGTYQNDMTIMLNLHHRDEKVREVYQNKNFRIALSHAINRQRLIDAVWNRQGEPYQPAPVPSSPYYDEEMAKQYTEYDPDLANQILDDEGYNQRDRDGFRLRPDGERIRVRVSIAQDGPISFWVQAMELVKEDWEAVGIECILDPKPREAFEDEKTGRNQDATVWLGEGGHTDAIFLPRQYFAFDYESHFGSAWATQWRGGTFDSEDDIPPKMPEAMARQQKLYDQFLAEPDEAKRDEIFREILAIAKEQFWCIGTVRVDSGYAVVHNRLKNVGGELIEASTFNTPAPANPEQWYIDESA